MFKYLGHVPSRCVSRHDVVGEDLKNVPFKVLHVLALHVVEGGRRRDEFDQRRFRRHFVRLGRAHVRTMRGLGRFADVPGDFEPGESVVGGRFFLLFFTRRVILK